MDKLQPILKNHFWILLVPLLSMNLWGYFSANGALKAAIATREADLDKVKGAIPAGATDVNAKYTTELKNRNELLEKYVNEELLDLWNRQQKRMIWPPRVAGSIPAAYGSEIKDNKVRYTYQTDYPNVIRELHQSVEPWVLDERGIDWTRKVDFPIQLIPQMKIGNLSISSKQMWDAQEDIWVTQFILDAIRQMNKDADSETSAVVRRVIAFRLLGGDGTAPGTAEGDPALSSPDMLSSSPGIGGRLTELKTSVAFNPVDEFGKGGESDLLSGFKTVMATPDPAASDPTAGPVAILRYVKEDPAAPFVERGFYLSVIINQNKLADFLVALSNSEWPVRVVRFHFGKNPYAEDPFRTTTGNSGTAMDISRFNAPASELGRDQLNPQGITEGTPYPADKALLHPELVQLDLAGLVTIFRQPPAALPQPPAEGAAPGVTPAEGTPPGESATPAPGTPTPTPETPDAGTPAPEGSPSESPAAGTPTSEPPTSKPLDPAPKTPENP